MAGLEILIDGQTEVQAALRRLPPGAKKAARMAINDTAVQARKWLDERARETYKVQRAKFNKSLKITKATNSTLTAVIRSNGRPLPLSYFEVRKNGMQAAKGHQLQSTSPVPLVKYGNKSFVATMKNEDKKGKVSCHRGIFVRVTKKRLKIEQLYGSSIPAMIGSQRVFGELEPTIRSDLRANLERHIDMVMRRV